MDQQRAYDEEDLTRHEYKTAAECHPGRQMWGRQNVENLFSWEYRADGCSYQYKNGGGASSAA